MKLTGRDYYEPEIAYYQHRLAEEGAELRLLSRLWDQPSLTFFGHEYKASVKCQDSFQYGRPNALTWQAKKSSRCWSPDSPDTVGSTASDTLLSW
jgi:hypothetical protein